MEKLACDQQIAATLEHNEAGVDVVQLCKDNKIGVSTYYKWKAKYCGLSASEILRLRGLEEENKKLTRQLEQAETDIAVLKDLLSKNW